MRFSTNYINGNIEVGYDNEHVKIAYRASTNGRSEHERIANKFSIEHLGQYPRLVEREPGKYTWETY